MKIISFSNEEIVDMKNWYRTNLDEFGRKVHIINTYHGMNCDKLESKLFAIFIIVRTDVTKKIELIRLEPRYLFELGFTMYYNNKYPDYFYHSVIGSSRPNEICMSFSKWLYDGIEKRPEYVLSLGHRY